MNFNSLKKSSTCCRFTKFLYLVYHEKGTNKQKNTCLYTQFLLWMLVKAVYIKGVLHIGIRESNMDLNGSTPPYASYIHNTRVKGIVIRFHMSLVK